ncbi:uncharacterized protein LOC129313425 [Prosopis cineraria]|uniref:uncharacterized protein LOC129313425 n=1 Tax=Prosopis cineraria TaxID=364024 RepID=UPI00240EC531|nr:uncharacterized protein LOC129313425 [Prosopis cineraria]
MSNLVAEGTNFDGIVEAMTGNGIGLSRTPEITSPVALQCSSPVEAQTPPVEPASAYEGPDRAQDACDSRGKMISVHSHSKEHNVNGATCMMNEGEGHNIFYDGRREKILLEDSDKDITVDPPSSRELISYGSPLNVSDRELSRQCESPLFPDQQTSDGVSLHMHDGQVPLEVPGTSREIAQCYNGRECRTEVVVLDRTVTSEEQEQMHSTMNNNNLSQALQDSQASLLTSPRMVDKDATVGERQNSSGPAELVSGPVDVIPADQSNPQSVMEPLEQVQQLPSAESLASNQGTGGEMQISASQVEAVSSPTDALPAGQFSHDPVVEPLEQVQQLASAESLASNPDTSGEMLNSSQRVEPVCCQIDVTQSNGLNHESLVGELLQQMQQFPPAESPNSNHYPSMATGIELRSNSEDSLSGRIPPAQMEVANQTVVHPASNSDLVSHAPLGAFRTQSLDTRNVFTPSEINNHLRQTATQSMNRMHSPLVIDPLKNELDRLRKESEQTLKYYEDTKLQLKSDCEREIEEIRRKYDIKLQESEVEFQLKRKTLDTSLNLVQMNQAWAEAFRSKCMDLRVSGASGTQQDPSFAQQLVWFSRQQRDMRPPLVASPPLGPPASTLQHFATAAGSQTMVPLVSSMQPFSPPASSQILGTPMPAPASSSPMVLPISTTTISQTMAPPLLAAYNAAPRPPHISSIPPLANHQAGSGFRTTPPHLQHYRPSTSLPDSGLPTPAHGVSSQQAPNSIPVIPSLPNHSRPTLSTNISDPRNRVHRPEIPAALTSPNLSAREPAMDGNCQPGLNLRNSLLRSSNVTSLQQSEFGTSSSVQDDSVRPAMSADIVCLSDDD